MIFSSRWRSVAACMVRRRNENVTVAVHLSRSGTASATTAT